MVTTPVNCFITPEGSHHLISEQNLLPPSPTPSTPQPTTPFGNASNLPPLSPPPPYPSKLKIVNVQIPSPFNSQTKFARSREPSSLSFSNDPSELNNLDSNPFESNPTNEPLTISQADTSNKLFKHASSNILNTKKKGLVSLPSLPSIPHSNSNTSSSSTLNSANTSYTRPKNAFKGTNSTFIKSCEGLPLPSSILKTLIPPSHTDDITWGLVVSGKYFIWTEIFPLRNREPLVRIQFNAFATTLAVHKPLASLERLDILVGFSTGDLIYLDPILGRYTRLNKSGCITASAVTTIVWSPWSATPGQFLTSHQDGCIIVWDKDREDTTTFIASTPLKAVYRSINSPLNNTNFLEAPESDLADDIVVTRPPLDKKGQTKNNPVSHWRVSKKSVTDFAFSPDLQYCAVASEDGCLRIIDVPSERLLDTYGSYFGALMCVNWSLDGRFVITGGQDDLVSVWAPLEQRIVARGQGHASFVTDIAIDNLKSDERMIRFASVSEDCRLILWDFSSAVLNRPKTHQPYSKRLLAASSLSLNRRRTLDSVGHLPLDERVKSAPVWHPPLRRNEVAMLQPVMVKPIASDLLTSFVISNHFMASLSRSGSLRLYSRPFGKLSRVANGIT